MIRMIIGDDSQRNSIYIFLRADNIRGFNGSTEIYFPYLNQTITRTGVGNAESYTFSPSNLVLTLSKSVGIYKLEVTGTILDMTFNFDDIYGKILKDLLDSKVVPQVATTATAFAPAARKRKARKTRRSTN
jgi:hypothetical protein